MDTKKNISSATKNYSPENCWLNNFSAFKNCSPELKDQLLSNSQKRTYSKGEVLIKTGEQEEGLFCIQSGIVKISQKGKNNKDFILSLAMSGDLLGLNALTETEPCAFSASATNDVIACYVPTADVKLILQKDPDVSLQLMQNICSKLDFIEQRIISISKKNIREQCAEILITIANEMLLENEPTLPINYSLKDLASFIGTTTSYLHKILLEFTTKEILVVRDRKYFINNVNDLIAIAEGVEKEKN